MDYSEALLAPTHGNGGTAQRLSGHKPHVDFLTLCSLRRVVSYQQKQWVVCCADFMHQLTLRLPEVAECIEESDFGYIHLEVGVLKLASRSVIVRQDLAAWHRHLLLVSDLFDRADHTLHEALRVSWLEALFLGESGAEFREMRSMLPRRMAQALCTAESRYASTLTRLGRTG